MQGVQQGIPIARHTETEQHITSHTADEQQKKERAGQALLLIEDAIDQPPYPTLPNPCWQTQQQKKKKEEH